MAEDNIVYNLNQSLISGMLKSAPQDFMSLIYHLMIY